LVVAATFHCLTGCAIGEILAAGIARVIEAVPADCGYV
jgi:hypothetical protein